MRGDHEGLRKLDEALAAGDPDGVRDALFALSNLERDLLKERLGEDGLERLYRRARRRRRATPEGRVIVLPGLMGTQLDCLDKKGDTDRIWFNPFRVLKGRLDELQLRSDGGALPSPPTVITDGVYPSVYMPLLLELEERWQVGPFGYDWRWTSTGARRAGRRGAGGWAQGEPAHLVVHSMGGLVSRRFIQHFPDVWASMQDPTARAAGAAW